MDSDREAVSGRYDRKPDLALPVGLRLHIPWLPGGSNDGVAVECGLTVTPVAGLVGALAVSTHEKLAIAFGDVELDNGINLGYGIASLPASKESLLSGCGWCGLHGSLRGWLRGRSRCRGGGWLLLSGRWCLRGG